MKTSELTGALLDYWTGKAEGENVEMMFGQCVVVAARYHDEIQCEHYNPTMTWTQGGPLIDKHGLNLLDKGYLRGTVHAANGAWLAYRTGARIDESIFGHTALQAICRAVVRAAFGDQVPDA